MSGVDPDLSQDIERDLRGVWRVIKWTAAVVTAVGIIGAAGMKVDDAAWWLIEPAHAQDTEKKVQEGVDRHSKITFAADKQADSRISRVETAIIAMQRTVEALDRRDRIAFCKTTLHGEWLPDREQCLLPDRTLYPPEPPTRSTWGAKGIAAAEAAGSPGDAAAPAPTISRKPRQRQPVQQLLPQ